MQTRIFIQRTLFDCDLPLAWFPKSKKPFPAVIPVPIVKPAPCRGCGARNYDFGRFHRTINCCVYCASDHVTTEKVLLTIRNTPLPQDDAVCMWPPGSKQRIQAYMARAKAGLSIFSDDDIRSEATPMKRCRMEGETGVERCVNKNGEVTRWRARTFFRSKKWNLGTYDHELEALSRVREFWKMHLGVPNDPPVMWMPCSGGDSSFAIERTHIEEWRQEFPGVDAVAVCKSLVLELRKVRRKPEEPEVFQMIVRRLADCYQCRKIDDVAVSGVEGTDPLIVEMMAA